MRTMENMNKIGGVLKYGFVENCYFSTKGLAIKNNEDILVAYDINTNSIINVELLNINANNVAYAYPIPTSKIKRGDFIIYKEDIPVCVSEVFSNGDLEIVDMREGTVKKILPIQSLFGFNYTTKVFPLIQPWKTSSKENPWGDMAVGLLANGKDALKNELFWMSLVNSGIFTKKECFMFICILNAYESMTNSKTYLPEIYEEKTLKFYTIENLSPWKPIKLLPNTSKENKIKNTMEKSIRFIDNWLNNGRDKLIYTYDEDDEFTKFKIFNIEKSYTAHLFNDDSDVESLGDYTLEGVLENGESYSISLFDFLDDDNISFASLFDPSKKAGKFHLCKEQVIPQKKPKKIETKTPWMSDNASANIENFIAYYKENGDEDIVFKAKTKLHGYYSEKDGLVYDEGGYEFITDGSDDGLKYSLNKNQTFCIESIGYSDSFEDNYLWVSAKNVWMVLWLSDCIDLIELAKEIVLDEPLVNHTPWNTGPSLFNLTPIADYTDWSDIATQNFYKYWKEHPDTVFTMMKKDGIEEFTITDIIELESLSNNNEKILRGIFNYKGKEGPLDITDKLGYIAIK